MSLGQAVVAARVRAALTAGAHLQENAREAAAVPIAAADTAIKHLEQLKMEFRAVFGDSWRDILGQLLDGLEEAEAER